MVVVLVVLAMTPEDEAYALALAEACVKHYGNDSSGVRILASYVLFLQEQKLQSERSICFRMKAFFGRLKSSRLTP